MNRNLMGGAAFAAMLIASPSLAQQPDTTLCALDNPAGLQAVDGLAPIDVDGDGRITLAEYQACLDANIAASDRQTYLDTFTRLDADGDQVVIIADLQTSAGGTETAAATQGQPARVAVQEQAADVNVSQAAPTVRVEQAEPEISVQQPQPQVAVQQREPEVEVQQRQPEVTVQQPEPTVSVEQAEAQVSVEQQQPQVSIDMPEPEVEVRQAQPQVSVEQRQPQVSVEQPEPEVQIQQAEANVTVQSEEPRVVVEQAEPQIEIQRVTPPANTTATRQSQATEERNREANVAQATDAEAEQDVAALAPPATAQLPFDEIEGESVRNNNGDEIGQISSVVMESSSGELYVVVSAGGFLGIGETDIVFPYGAVSMQGDEVHINTNISQDQLTERQNFDESRFVDVPEDRVVR